MNIRGLNRRYKQKSDEKKRKNELELNYLHEFKDL